MKLFLKTNNKQINSSPPTIPQRKICLPGPKE
ncbi:hypothetical protein LEMLEM_LOCUS16029 [Lemmus lemmus]